MKKIWGSHHKFIYHINNSNGVVCRCNVDIMYTPEKAIVIIQERDDNCGESVEKVYADVATALFRWRLNSVPVIWVENSSTSMHQVCMEWDGTRFIKPERVPITPEEIGEKIANWELLPIDRMYSDDYD